MAFPSPIRLAAENPRRFLVLVAFVGICSALVLALQAAVPDSGSARTAIVLTMFLVAAVYVGSTHETLEADSE
jgi:hypothetical protein